MGYYLWIEGDLAWAQGTYEYRPVGTAVISMRDTFRRRDFSPRRKAPRPWGSAYIGQFASLGQLNMELRDKRRGRIKR
jgi:hypothetical protein